MAERTFEYLLNQMEDAGQSVGAKGYAEKRGAVLGYVAALQEKIAGQDSLLVAYRLGSDQRQIHRADAALARIEKANARLAALTARTVAANA